MPPPRKVTRVAVGVLLRDDGSVLLADRPAGKPYAGYWEFPGGKIEEGESVDRALERELHEELGIVIGPSHPWVTFEFDYPHAYVELQFRLVCRWRGEPHAREGQRLRFADPRRELPQPLLPAAVPALRWLLLPTTIYVVSDRIDELQQPGCAEVAPLAVADAGQGVLVECDHSGFGWKGVWADDEDDLRGAASSGCDFALVRSPELAGRFSEGARPLPVYLPAGSSVAERKSADPCSRRRWIDLRSAGSG